MGENQEQTGLTENAVISAKLQFRGKVSIPGFGGTLSTQCAAKPATAPSFIWMCPPQDAIMRLPWSFTSAMKRYYTHYTMRYHAIMMMAGMKTDWALGQKYGFLRLKCWMFVSYWSVEPSRLLGHPTSGARASPATINVSCRFLAIGFLGNNAARHIILNIFTVQRGVPIKSDHDGYSLHQSLRMVLVNHSGGFQMRFCRYLPMLHLSCFGKDHKIHGLNDQNSMHVACLDKPKHQIVAYNIPSWCPHY